MKIRFSRFLFLMLSVAVAGCSQQDFSRPASRTPSKVLQVRKPRNENETASAEQRAERLAEMLSRWTRQSSHEPKNYVIGSGDELSISVYALEDPQQTTVLKRSVTSEGTVSLPWIGDVKTSGISVRELESRITEAYADRYIKNPQISVEVSQYRSVAIVMTGAIRNPGVYYLTDNKTTVLEMLAKCGGLTDEAADEILIVQGDTASLLPADTNAPVVEVSEQLTRDAMLSTTNQVIAISMRQLIDEGDLRMNVDITGGAIITVKSMAQQYVYVLGYVQRPGSFTIRGPQQLDALRAVALAGGLSPTARAENSFIVREIPEGQNIIPVNLIRIARGGDPTIYLEPGDTLIVGSSAIARLSEFVRPSVGAGMNYSPAP